MIASHVIEHTPDLISFLNDCDAVLKDEGVLSLVIPDKRYCFDHFRPLTGISKIIDHHFQKATIHSPGSVAEYFLNIVLRSGQMTWNSNTPEEYSLIHSLENARKGIKSVVNEKAYLDVHAWCFTHHSFRLIIHDLFSLGLIAFQEVDFFPTDGFEFYVTLGRKGKGLDQPRIEMLKIIESEIKDPQPQRNDKKIQLPIQLPEDFEPDIYLRLNPDVAEANIDPETHYLNFGIKEGRKYI